MPAARFPPIIAVSLQLPRAGLAMIIGDIEPIRIVEGNAVPLMALLMVPGNEADRVGEIRAARHPSAGLRLIARPGAVESLRVSVGRGNPRPWDEAEEFRARRLGIMTEAGFRIDRCHQDWNRHAIFALRLIGGPPPIVEKAISLLENRAGIPGIPRHRSAAGQQQEDDDKNATHR